MSIQLPTRPNLEHLRSQAKALLSSLRAGETAALALFSEFLPGAGAKPSLADAQTVIARRHGFASWPRVVHHVETLRSLEGTWHFTSMEVEGISMGVGNLVGASIEIEGDTFRVNSAGTVYVGVFVIDMGVTPHTIDMNFVEGPEAGRSSLGIFETSGDDWKICLGLTGVARPTEFVSTPGSSHVVETLHRGSLAPLPSEQKEPELDLSTWEVVTPELERIQGTWRPRSITMNGMELPAAHIAEGVRTTIGTETTLKFGPQVWMQAMTKVNASQTPIHIDYLHTGGQGKGMVQRGILVWEGDSFAVCMGKPAGPRPTEFAAPKGSGFTLSWWDRVS